MVCGWSTWSKDDKSRCTQVKICWSIHVETIQLTIRCFNGCPRGWGLMVSVWLISLLHWLTMIIPFIPSNIYKFHNICDTPLLLYSLVWCAVWIFSNIDLSMLVSAGQDIRFILFGTVQYHSSYVIVILLFSPIPPSL